MRTTLVRAWATDTLRAALAKMTASHVQQVLVYEKTGELVGIVNEQDLRPPPPVPGRPGRAPAERALEEMRLGQVLASEVIAVSPDSTLAEAAAMMLDHDIGTLPVMEKNRVIGIITATDLLSTLAGRPAHEAALPPPTVAGCRADIHATLCRCENVAVVGLGTDASSPAATETTKLLTRGVTVYPIHPAVTTLLGIRCYESLAAVPTPLDIVQVFPQEDLDLLRLTKEVIDQHVQVFWYEGLELPDEVVRLLAEQHVEVVVAHSLQTELLSLRAGDGGV